MSELYEEEADVIDEEMPVDDVVIEGESEADNAMNSARRRLEAMLEERRLRNDIEDFLDE